MTATRPPRPMTAFPLSTGIKRPRQVNEAHRKFVADLPCCICGASSVAAHVRFGAILYGKPGSGVGEKPSDKYCVPLCPNHHTDGAVAQHTRGEQAWWDAIGIDPILLSALLWQVTGDLDEGNAIIRLRPRRVFSPIEQLSLEAQS